MLQRPIKGRGGFQSLMRRIQLGLRGRQLVVEQADINALIRATKGRAIGGFQRRARDIIVDAVIDRLRADGFQIREDGPAKVLPFHEHQRVLPFGENLE